MYVVASYGVWCSCLRFGDIFQLAVVRQVLRKEIGLKIVEVDSEKAFVEGGDVLWTGDHFHLQNKLFYKILSCHVFNAFCSQ